LSPKCGQIEPAKGAAVKIAPVLTYAPPAYPARDAVALDPSLLSRHVPLAWLRNEVVAGALAAFVVGGCWKSESKGDAVAAQREPRTKHAVDNSPVSSGERLADAKVAPVFNHGPGRGAVGCIVMSPPVFVSESEAREIIEAEFGKADINFREHGIRVKDVYLDRTHVHYSASDGAKRKENSETEYNALPVVLDGWDGERKLGYLFVSTEDYSSSVEMHYRSTVRRFETQKVAEQIREKLAQSGSVNAAVFYDPLTNGEEEKEIVRALSNENRKGESADSEMIGKLQGALQATWAKGSTDPRYLLRLQVRDFIAWAKREGVLK
jgi:hypothetical protein